MDEQSSNSLVDMIIPQWGRDWIKQQGVSTILLFSILVLCWYGVPYIADRATEHIDKLTSASEKNLKSVIDAFEADQERDEKRNERKDELLKELLQRNGFAGELEPARDLP